jgi:hypothetical protein
MALSFLCTYLSTFERRGWERRLRMDPANNSPCHTFATTTLHAQARRLRRGCTCTGSSIRPSLALARLFRPSRSNSHQGPTDNRRVSFHLLSPSGGLYRWDCALHRMRRVHAVRTRVALSGRVANSPKVFLAKHDTRYYDSIYDLLVG